MPRNAEVVRQWKMLECLAGAPFTADLKTGFDKLAGVLIPLERKGKA